MSTVDEITGEADDYGFTRLSSARKISLLNQSYQRINQVEAWPYLAAQDTTVDYTDRVVTDPTDFLRVTTLFKVVNGSNNQVKYLGEEAWQRLPWGTPETGTVPRWFSYTGASGSGADPESSSTVLEVYPGLGSGVSGTLNMRYIRRAADLAASGAESTILLPPRHHALLRYRFLFELFLLEKDLTMSEHFRSLADEALNLAKRDLLEESYEPDYITWDDTYDDN